VLFSFISGGGTGAVAPRVTIIAYRPLRAPKLAWPIGPHDEIPIVNNEGHWQPRATASLNWIRAAAYRMVPRPQACDDLPSRRHDLNFRQPGTPMSARRTLSRAGAQLAVWRSVMTMPGALDARLNMDWIIPAAARYGPRGASGQKLTDQLLFMGYASGALFATLRHEWRTEAGPRRWFRMPGKFGHRIMRGRVNPRTDKCIRRPGARLVDHRGAGPVDYFAWLHGQPGTNWPVAFAPGHHGTKLQLEISRSARRERRRREDTGKYGVGERWNYYWSGNYGSKH